MLLPVSDPTRTGKARAFLRDGFSDYVAARVLLLDNLPQQGAILSSTALEKCAKAFIALRGEKVAKTHLKPEHWEALLAHDANAQTLFDNDFVQLNQRVYGMRYTGDLPNGFNLVIASREFLAELDHMVSIIVSALKIYENGQRQKSFFEKANARGDDRVLRENHTIIGPSKSLFIALRPQLVYEVRRDAKRGLVEVTYSTREPAKVAGFLRPGLQPTGDGRSVEFSHWPVSPPDGSADYGIIVSESG